MGTRSNAVVDEPTTLQFQFLKDGLNFEPFSIKRIEIYPTYADAVASTNIIEIITSINTNGDGLLTYVAAAIDINGTYFDKPIIEPTNGAQDWSNIKSFIVKLYFRVIMI